MLKSTERHYGGLRGFEKEILRNAVMMMKHFDSSSFLMRGEAAGHMSITHLLWLNESLKNV